MWFLLPDAPANVAAAEFGFDPTFIGSVHAGRRLAGAVPSQVEATVAVPLFARPLGARLEAGGQVLLRRDAGWGVGLGATLDLTHSADATVVADGLGLGLMARPGWTQPAGGVALDLRYQPTLLAHLTPTEVARDAFPGKAPSGGWAAAPGQRGRVGLAATWAPDPVQLTLCGGWSWVPGGFPDIGALPFYAQLQGGVRW